MNVGVLVYRPCPPFRSAGNRAVEVKERSFATTAQKT